jgi:hypothetical protein
MARRKKDEGFKIKSGPFKGKTLVFAKNSYGELLYEIPEVVCGIEPFFISDESHLLDFEPDEAAQAEMRRKFFAFYGMELPADPKEWSLGKLAAMIYGSRQEDS